MRLKVDRSHFYLKMILSEHTLIIDKTLKICYVYKNGIEIQFCKHGYFYVDFK